jgi:ADP-ribosylglycohydrolase
MGIDSQILGRAQGCLLGQLAGDSLGSLVEFQSPDEIRRRYPNGVRELADGGTWGTIAGQPTDDSEMALSLARTLIDRDARCGMGECRLPSQGADRADGQGRRDATRQAEHRCVASFQGATKAYGHHQPRVRKPGRQRSPAR